MELCMREKTVFFLPVNILTVWSPAFLAARHTTVCLDICVLYILYKELCVGVSKQKVFYIRHKSPSVLYWAVIEHFNRPQFYIR